MKPRLGSRKMKKLMAAFALLCLSNTVLAHDIYSTLRDREGHLCCGGQDCKPVQAVVLPNGSYYLPASGETIPADTAAPSPDERFHQCIYFPMANEFDPWGGPVFEDKPKTRCFFAPMNSW
jgi:hypothetical protein